MKEGITLIFEALKNKEITPEQAEKHILDLFDVISGFIELGKRETMLGETLNFPLMDIVKISDGETRSGL